MEKNGILLLHGTDHQDMTLRILREAKLTEHLTDKAMRIGIKPNLVVAASADGGADAGLSGGQLAITGAFAPAVSL